ncbi:hypothetical protein OE88DRAFT_852748 [Heliocybe sulcata]|uniref:WW domain-containing protein n=1 Tax=Heliocybe sulcata TaxID=5364 RepID=A0A5C3MNU6_9AGAM|nr:hypothetical protein OE88DRAFT_852748 [Heliocybe sulcata]
MVTPPLSEYLFGESNTLGGGYDKSRRQFARQSPARVRPRPSCLPTRRSFLSCLPPSPAPPMSTTVAPPQISITHSEPTLSKTPSTRPLDVFDGTTSAGPSHARNDGSLNTQGAVWGSNFWVTLVDPQTQASFYACPATGEVSWDPPVGNFVLPPSDEGEWWELLDDTRNLPYYYHTKSGETVWERPDAFVIPLGVLQVRDYVLKSRRIAQVHP